MIGSLDSRQALLENIIHSFLLRPIKTPSCCLRLSPLSILEGFQYAIMKGRFKCDIWTES